jgi:spore germination cell wall hydrolase CwlJ-like protein
MIEDREPSRALVVTPQQARPVVGLRHSELAVIPPRPLPVVFRARRSFAKLTKYGVIAAVCGFFGYAWHDNEIRAAIDYRVTLLTAAGVSDITPTAASEVAEPEPLPAYAKHLFAGNQKGPRADRLAYAMRTSTEAVSRTVKSSPLRAYQPAVQTAALAGAELFLSAFTPADPLIDSASAAPAKAAAGGSGEWAGLLKNATLSPEQPQTLFGGLTEDEFRKRELRCMATAIYFEARDEPQKGQIAVAQVIMNRIRSPFYPKTVCGVVYQGERNRHGCQFSFTCTGKSNSVREKPEWATAVKLAKQVIAGEVWEDEVGYATHYHATYVNPEWRHELDKVAQIGGHIFYKMKPGTTRIALLSEGL